MHGILPFFSLNMAKRQVIVGEGGPDIPSGLGCPHDYPQIILPAAHRCFKKIIGPLGKKQIVPDFPVSANQLFKRSQFPVHLISNRKDQERRVAAIGF